METTGPNVTIEKQNEGPVVSAGRFHGSPLPMLSNEQVHNPGELVGSPTPANVPAVRTGQQSNVFQRLQALFPGSPNINTPSSPTHDLLTTPQLSDQRTNNQGKQGPQALKVKIITWNMHDSLPKGDLEELLGKVPLYTPSSDVEKDIHRMPDLPLDGNHPYHLVVVAGQECPTSSGIPMGLGAAFNNIIEREKSKEKEKEKDKEIKRHRSSKSTSGDKENSYRKLQDRDESHKSSTEVKQHKSEEDDEKDKLYEDSQHVHLNSTTGWSAALESWFCQAIGSDPSSSRVSLSAPLTSHTDANSSRHHFHHLGHLRNPSKELNGYPLTRQKSPISPLGPYELLIKERLMGMYLAVFIYRELKPLVRGVDRSAVAAGLIGGRVGNKGGVAISLNLNGTTLLFVNAHLAAHEERTQHRIQNLAKIKAELEIDDYLSEDDPRSESEDLTDKFDYTFIFGDLNFRLNVTRLHADWLISRQEYEQALCFDQLREIMQKGNAFAGFSEASINFPPTFKYDVLRSLKGSKSVRRSRDHNGAKHERNVELSEVEEKANENIDDCDEAANPDENADVAIDVSEAASITSRSTAGTSMQSSRRTTTNTDIDDDEYDYFGSSPGRPKGFRRKSFVHGVAEKAKTKWLSLLSPSTTSFRTPSLRTPSPLERDFRDDGDRSANCVSHSTAELVEDHHSPASLPSAVEYTPLNKKKERPRSLSIRRSVSSVKRLQKKTEPDDNDEDEEKGVYDSSSKKRVPSWCDRILWKSTVQPSGDDDANSIVQEPVRLRPRVVSFLAQALRPRSRLSLLFSSSPSNTQPQLTMGLGLSSSISQDAQVSSPNPSLSTTKLVSDVNINPRVRPPKLYLSKSVEPAVSDTEISTRLLLQKGPVRPKRSKSLSVNIISRPPNWSPIAEQKRQNVLTEEPTSQIAPNISDVKGLSSRTNSAKWWLPPFFTNNRDSSPNIDASPTITGNSVLTLRPRRGQIIPLGYGTLDDQAMRRLEGRSDHRPVIGSYAIYV